MKRAYVPIAPGWLADIDPQTSEHGPIDVLFIEIEDPDGNATVWGIDTEGHLICDLARKARFRRPDGSPRPEDRPGQTHDSLDWTASSGVETGPAPNPAVQPRRTTAAGDPSNPVRVFESEDGTGWRALNDDTGHVVDAPTYGEALATLYALMSGE